MSDFISAIVSGDLSEILGEELYAPTVATVVASWAILAFAGVVEAFKLLLLAIFNKGYGGKL